MSTVLRQDAVRQLALIACARARCDHAVGIAGAAGLVGVRGWGLAPDYSVAWLELEHLGNDARDLEETARTTGSRGTPYTAGSTQYSRAAEAKTYQQASHSVQRQDSAIIWESR